MTYNKALSNTTLQTYKVYCKNTPTQRAVTFEGLVQLVLPKYHSEVVDGASVKLHPEHHVSGGVSVPLVVTLQLQSTTKERDGL